MEPFKNVFNLKSTAAIAEAIHRGYPKFDSAGFLHDIVGKLKPLELKDRVRFLAKRLEEFLPANPKRAFLVLVGALKKDESDAVGVDGFLVWPFTEYVAAHGFEAYDEALAALKEMTKVFTAEWAIRPFLAHHEKKTLAVLERWSKDPDEHVRRLVSEGTRPLLPWGERLYAFVEDPEKTWPFLERLRNDPSEYVRRSVANHVNDHSKHHPKFVLERLAKWGAEKTATKESRKLVHHSLRTLIKKGDPAALKLVGVDPKGIAIEGFRVKTRKLALGEDGLATLRLRNTTKKALLVVVDHEVKLLGSRGQHRTKVFKGRKFTLPAGEKVTVELRLKLKAVTVRQYYSGEQFWCVLVNGRRSKACAFRVDV
jgi:3-methyladenine DNA glycosylase AlkC